MRIWVSNYELLYKDNTVVKTTDSYYIVKSILKKKRKKKVYWSICSIKLSEEFFIDRDKDRHASRNTSMHRIL